MTSIIYAAIGRQGTVLASHAAKGGNEHLVALRALKNVEAVDQRVSFPYGTCVETPRAGKRSPGFRPKARITYELLHL